MSREATIVVTLIAYKVVLLLLGFWGQRRTRSSEDFYLAGRGLGPVVAAVSASASSSSAWTLLGISGFAYKFGLSAVWLFPACVGGFLINWFLLAPGLRRLTGNTGALTVTAALAGPKDAPLYGTIKTIASLIIVISLGFYVCYQFQAAGITFNTTFDIDRNLSIALGGAIVALYTLLGGFWAVSLTDTLQGMLMALTGLVLPAAALLALGGPGELASRLQADPEALSLAQGLPWAGALGFVFGLLGIGLGYPGQPHVVNRFMALKDDGPTLRSARRVALTWAVVVYGGMVLLGLCCRYLYPGITNNETLFIHATNNLFPPIISGIMLASVLSAIMSTADSQLLVAASSFTHDLGWAGRRKDTLLQRSRIVVLLLSAAAIVAAMTVDTSIFSGVLFAWGAMGAAFGPLLLVTVLRGPVPPGRTVLAMLVGCGLAIVGFQFKDADMRFMERIVPYVAAFAILLWPSTASLKARRE